MNPALHRPSPDSAILVYVDYVTGLDNLMNRLPAQVYKNNIAAFAKMNPLFKMPTVVLGEENEYYGTFLPEMAHVTHDIRRYNRTRISGYIPEFADWLASTGRKDVIIGGISLDNCVLHTALDLLRAGYNVFVIVDVSGTNSPISEDVAMMRLRDAGAVMCTWLSIVTELGVDFASQYGDGMKAIIGAHWPASTVGPVDDSTPDGHGMQLPA
jgi:Isochorismatase family